MAFIPIFRFIPITATILKVQTRAFIWLMRPQEQQSGMKRSGMTGLNRRIFFHINPVIPLRYIPDCCFYRHSHSAASA